jgi:hypothetical protein
LSAASSSWSRSSANRATSAASKAFGCILNAVVVPHISMWSRARLGAACCCAERIRAAIDRIRGKRRQDDPPSTHQDDLPATDQDDPPSTH